MGNLTITTTTTTTTTITTTLIFTYCPLSQPTCDPFCVRNDQLKTTDLFYSILFYSILFYSAMPQVSIIDFSSLNIAFFLQSQCADVHDRECVCARMQTLPSVLHLSST